MRILIHDWGSYQFILELADALARGGDQVLHLYCGSLQGPNVRPDEEFEGVVESRSLLMERPYRKYTLVRRSLQEQAYGRTLARVVLDEKPDVVVCANTPTPVLGPVMEACRRTGSKFVLWMQDVYYRAVRHGLASKLPDFVAGAVAHPFRRFEQHVLQEAQGVIFISQGFQETFGSAVGGKSLVLENWGSLRTTPLLPKDNGWARQHGLVDVPVVLYAGTLGVKHNAEMLLGLAEVAGESGARVVVVSEGPGADQLRRQKGKRDALTVLPYQPREVVPQMLASADVLTALLDAGAGRFSIPSKVLTYLCAGRPVLMAAPLDNPAARLLLRSGAGFAYASDDRAGFIDGARTLLGDAGMRGEMGRAARQYAQANYNIDVIRGKFRDFIMQVWGGSRLRPAGVA